MRRKVVAVVLTCLLALQAMASGVWAAEGVAIDGSNFPDETFRSYVEGFDADGDSVLSESELAGVTDIDVTSMGIYDLTGIEYFTALENLYCDDNHLTSLDMSSNTELKILRCSDNQLTSLNVRNNMLLKSLGCTNNPLPKLDLPSSWEFYGYARQTIEVNLSESDGSWQLDLADLVGSDSISKVTIISEVEGMTVSDGVVTFTGTVPESLIYRYDTGYVEAILEVELLLGYDGEQDPGSDPVVVPESTNGTYVIGSGDSITIYCTGELEDFVQLFIDDELVDPSNYTLEDGSTILTLNSAFLDTLSPGEHKASLEFTTGVAVTTINILTREQAGDSETDDNSDSKNEQSSAQDNETESDFSADRNTDTGDHTGAQDKSGANHTTAPQTGDKSSKMILVLLTSSMFCCITLRCPGKKTAKK